MERHYDYNYGKADDGDDDDAGNSEVSKKSNKE